MFGTFNSVIHSFNLVLQSKVKIVVLVSCTLNNRPNKRNVEGKEFLPSTAPSKKSLSRRRRL